MKTCLRSDPEFDDCSRQAVQQLFNALGPGKYNNLDILYGYRNSIPYSKFTYVIQGDRLFTRCLSDITYYKHFICMLGMHVLTFRV